MTLPSALEFFGLEEVGDLEWVLPVTLPICGGSGFLHGGCALGAAATALATSLERPVAWATAQYLSRVSPGETARLSIEPAVVGNSVTQASLTCRHGDEVIFRVLAALGGRELGIDGQWVDLGALPPPEDCPPRPRMFDAEVSFTELANVRIASSVDRGSTVRYWARLDGGLAGTPGIQAALADLLPSGMRVSQMKEMMGNSLDNTVRFGPERACDWVLVETVTEAFSRGVGFGTARVFHPDGQLLVSASQSFAITRVTADLD